MHLTIFEAILKSKTTNFISNFEPVKILFLRTWHNKVKG